MWCLIKLVFCWVMHVIKVIGGFTFWTATGVFLSFIFALSIFYCIDPEMTKYCIATTEKREKMLYLYILRWAALLWISGGLVRLVLCAF